MNDLITQSNIESKILVLRGKQVMLDRDIAELYGVETRRLNEQVKRNIERFPEEFMFKLRPEEFMEIERKQNLMSQNATSSWGGNRKSSYAFTKQGVAMLSGVLRSETAIAVSISAGNIFQGQIFDAYAKFESFIVQASK